MLAALVIIKALKENGQKFYGSVRSYNQERGALRMPRQKALRAVKALARSHKGADTTDGVKIWLSRKSWVLIRPSNTEDVMRVSAEAETPKGAVAILKKYMERVRELSK
jgi:phosphomannomutase